MRICFVGPANSAHIKKWSNWFATHGHEIHVISFTPDEIVGATVHLIATDVNTSGNDLQKMRYLLTGGKIRKIIKEIRPDVVSAHYATSYGVAMALSGIKRYVLSVWGSDIYEFPQKSVFHKLLLQYSLKKAGRLFSTSQAMADEASKYTSRKFEITPFGVDMKLFNPDKRTRNNDGIFMVGTVKGLSETYGIRYILEAVAEIKRLGTIPVHLRIAGKGPQEKEYHELAKTLGIDDITTWLGFISQEQAAIEWANMDVAVIPSVMESFGVAAVEAQASGTPVIISDVDGLKETTVPGVTSIVVPKENGKAIAEAIIICYEDFYLRDKMGTEGRRYVAQKYELNNNFEYIEKLFEQAKKYGADS